MYRPLATGAALLLVLLVGGPACADPISWGYNWSASPAFLTGGSGKITLSNEPPHTAFDNSNVVATNLQVFSTADPLVTSDTFGPSDGKYSLSVQLTDVATLKTGILTFMGQLQGSFSSLSANVTNTFFSPQTQSIVLGGTKFVVTMNSYTPPGPPDQGNLGSIGAYVQVSRAPEPATLLLAGLGAGLAGLAGWRRRRKKAAALAA
jgi:hypothetical protein